MVLNAEEILQGLLSSGKLDTEDLAELETQMNIDKVKKIHHNSISKRKDGRYTTKITVNGIRKQFSAPDEKSLYLKLYDFYFPKNVTTLEKMYRKWMVYRRDNTAVKQKTLQEATYEWKRFYAETDLASMDITEIKPVTIIRFFRKITKNREHTAKRISNARSLLNGIFQFAIEEELILHNPVSEVNFKQFPYKPVNNQEEVFTIKETIQLLQYLQTINDEPYALAIRLDFNLMIRIGELKALRFEDVDFVGNTINIRRQSLIERQMNDDLTFSERTTVISDQMKGYTSYGFRKHPLTPEAVRIIKQAKELNPNGEYIFMPEHRTMTTDAFNRRLKKYCKEAGVPYHSSHKVRFFAASTAYTGDNLVTISRLMGHSNIQTTMHYLRNVHDDSLNVSTANRLGLENNLALHSK